MDVYVTFTDGSSYTATFFTVQNVEFLMRRYEQTGECANGLYLWASDMILVRELTEEAITHTIADLLSAGEFFGAFSQA